MSSRRRIGRSLLLLLLATSTQAAKAQSTTEATIKECIAAFDRAQRAKTDGHLRRARAELLACGRMECPVVVRADCASVLREVEQAQPTVVLKASDAQGRDVTDVRVSLDSEPLAASLDGRAVPVDPGKVSFTFDRPPWAAVKVEVLVNEMEKGRVVAVTLGPPAPPGSANVGRSETPPPGAAPERSALGWALPGALAGLGLVGLGYAGVRRLSLESDIDELKARCGPTCPTEDRARLSSDLVATNVILGIGIGGLVLATAAWFLLAPRSPTFAARKAAFDPWLRSAMTW